MKEFNFNKAFGSKERVEWLKENHDKLISQDEYIRINKEHLKRFSTCGSNQRIHHCYKPSYLKRQYNHLVEVFGFFQG